MSTNGLEELRASCLPEDKKPRTKKSTKKNRRLSGQTYTLLYFRVFSGFWRSIQVSPPLPLAVLKPLSKAFGIFPSFPQGNPNIYTYVVPQMELSVCMAAGSISTKDSYRYIFSGRSLPINLIFFWTEWLHCYIHKPCGPLF